MSKLMVIIISILFVLLSGCSDVSTITITQTVTPTSVAETPKPTVTNSTTSPDYFKLSLNDLGETYKGDGYTISYPSNWFLSTISPTEIRLIPPNNSSGGLIAIRATHDGIRVLGASAYYSDSAFCLRVQEGVLRDYCNKMGVSITKIKYNGIPLFPSKDWEMFDDWIIYFHGIYDGNECDGEYYINDVVEKGNAPVSYTYLKVQYAPSQYPWKPDVAWTQFDTIASTFRYTSD